MDNVTHNESFTYPIPCDLRSTEIKLSPIADNQSKNELLKMIADEVGLTRKQIIQIFESLERLIFRHLRRGGSGEIILPGLGIKLKRIHKPGTKGRKMLSPLTGKEVFLEPKPERDAVKIIPLKTIKNMLDN